MKQLASGLGALVIALVLIALPSSAAAQTIAAAGPDGSFSNLVNFQTPLGQVVTAPSNLPLQSFTFRLSNTGAGPVSVTPSVANWAAGARGAVIWTGAPIIVPVSAPTTVTFQTGGLAVIANQQYSLELANPTADPVRMETVSPGTTYPGGGAVQGNSENVNFDFIFSATFAPTPIPTLAEWGMILFGLGLVASALVVVRRGQVSA